MPQKYFCLIFYTALLLFLSCEKDNDSEFVSTSQPSFSDRIFLRALEQTDSSVTLNWTKFTSNCFSSYYLLRGTGTDSSSLSYYSDLLTSISNQNKLFFTDNSQPLASSIKYQIYASGCGNSCYSNLVFVEREGILTFELENFFDAIKIGRAHV